MSFADDAPQYPTNGCGYGRREIGPLCTFLFNLGEYDFFIFNDESVPAYLTKGTVVRITRLNRTDYFGYYFPGKVYDMGHNDLELTTALITNMIDNACLEKGLPTHA